MYIYIYDMHIYVFICMFKYMQIYIYLSWGKGQARFRMVRPLDGLKYIVHSLLIQGWVKANDLAYFGR